MWILILTLVVQRNEPAPALATLEFHDKPSCEYAMREWAKGVDGFKLAYAGTKNYHAVCVPKSTRS